jgi:signal transduction histidine kinase
VKVTLRSVPAPAGSRTARTLPWVCLTVHDTGPGIPANAIERVFQPFFSTKRRKANAGLGLTVALTFVQHLGGILRSSSSPHGAEFEVLLPSKSKVKLPLKQVKGIHIHCDEDVPGEGELLQHGT